MGNFVYQITMIIRSGLANTGSRASPLGAGPQFRIESSQNNPHYGLLFNTLGNWSFYVVVNNNGSPLLTPLGGVRCGDPCPHFKTGYNQPNVFTIWAVGSQLDVWLNGYLIDSTSDPAVPSGFLGVRLNGGNSSSSVEFRDLRVWQQ
ncbi:MAG: hypothetical protein JO202_05535 [Ktedonobacteraceae bacterium]|nr:hypothetical protein [Ktedonobacteraceae bacterium]